METALVYVHLSQKRWFSKSLQLILFFIYDSILFPVLILRLNGTFTATNSGVYFGSWIFCLLSFISLFPPCLYTVYIFFCPHRWVFKCFGRVGLSELRLCKAPFSLNLCLLSSLSASISFGCRENDGRLALPLRKADIHNKAPKVSRLLYKWFVPNHHQSENWWK